MAVSDEGSMTLVFNRAALERLADPQSTFEDARQWTEVIGLVSDEEPERLSSYADRQGIDPDFISSAGGQVGGLAVVRQQFATGRHVFVGVSDEDRGLAESLGWEYLPVTEAAEAADWTLAADEGRWRGGEE
ncbi:hypothetical protein ACH9L7_14210 [Haloferax sp. S1W]|uniref:DUF7124 domain-containing protein n=1 Tax=Haloferax sp. S1W TaxID=3377110 RepID=UPI0037C641BE